MQSNIFDISENWFDIWVPTSVFCIRQTTIFEEKFKKKKTFYTTGDPEFLSQNIRDIYVSKMNF